MWDQSCKSKAAPGSRRHRATTGERRRAARPRESVHTAALSARSRAPHCSRDSVATGGSAPGSSGTPGPRFPAWVRWLRGAPPPELRAPPASPPPSPPASRLPGLGSPSGFAAGTGKLHWPPDPALSRPGCSDKRRAQAGRTPHPRRLRAQPCLLRRVTADLGCVGRRGCLKKASIYPAAASIHP